MKFISKMLTIFLMEAYSFFQNRKQIIITFLLGPIMVFAMMYAMGGISTAESRIEIYGAQVIREVLAEAFESDEGIVFKEGTVDHKSRASAEKNTVVIAVEQVGVCIYYDSALLTDSELLYTAQALADRIVALQINEDQYLMYDENVSAIRSVDISSAGDQIGAVLIPLVSMVFIIALMLANTSISSMATDTVAGERERGTFDMLRLSGTKISTIILGKYAFIVLVGLAVLITEAAFLALGLRHYQQELYRIAAEQAAKNPLWFLPLLMCLFSISIMTTALYIALSASFEKAKQATAYASIVQLVLSLFTYAPNVLGGEVLNYLPISNLWIVLQRTLEGQSAALYVASGTGIALVVAVAAIFYATTILEKETKR